MWRTVALVALLGVSFHSAPVAAKGVEFVARTFSPIDAMVVQRALGSPWSVEATEVDGGLFKLIHPDDTKVDMNQLEDKLRNFRVARNDRLYSTRESKPTVYIHASTTQAQIAHDTEEPSVCMIGPPAEQTYFTGRINFVGNSDSPTSQHIVDYEKTFSQQTFLGTSYVSLFAHNNARLRKSSSVNYCVVPLGQETVWSIAKCMAACQNQKIIALAGAWRFLPQILMEVLISLKGRRIVLPVDDNSHSPTGRDAYSKMMATLQQSFKHVITVASNLNDEVKDLKQRIEPDLALYPDHVCPVGQLLTAEFTNDLAALAVVAAAHVAFEGDHAPGVLERKDVALNFIQDSIDKISSRPTEQLRMSKTVRMNVRPTSPSTGVVKLDTLPKFPMKTASQYVTMDKDAQNKLRGELSRTELKSNAYQQSNNQRTGSPKNYAGAHDDYEWQGNNYRDGLRHDKSSIHGSHPQNYVDTTLFSDKQDSQSPTKQARQHLPDWGYISGIPNKNDNDLATSTASHNFEDQIFNLENEQVGSKASARFERKKGDASQQQSKSNRSRMSKAARLAQKDKDMVTSSNNVHSVNTQSYTPINRLTDRLEKQMLLFRPVVEEPSWVEKVQGVPGKVYNKIFARKPKPIEMKADRIPMSGDVYNDQNTGTMLPRGQASGIQTSTQDLPTDDELINRYKHQDKRGGRGCLWKFTSCYNPDTKDASPRGKQ